MTRFVVCFAACCLLGSGCGKQSYQVIKTSGVCLCEGEPIASGWVQLSPIPENDKTLPGKTAMGRIQADGSFVLSTYSEGDGAVLGPHRVRIMEPAMPEPREIADGAEVPVKHGCTLPEELVVEVLPDIDNDFTIKLVKKAKPATSSSRPNYEG